MEVNLIKETKTNEGLHCLLFSLLLGVVFDRLFIDKAFGISFFIFISLCTAFFLWSIKDRVSFQKNAGWLLLIPIGVISFSFTVYTNEILLGLNILLIPILMVASSILINNPNLEWYKITFIFEMLRKGIVNVIENMPMPFKIIKKSIGESVKVEVKESKKQIIIGLLISLPLLIIIIMLLSSADMVFNYYLRNITDIFNNIDLGDFPAHVIIVALISFYLFGYVWSFKSNSKTQTKNLEIGTLSWEAITIITVLAALNIIYLIFTVIQFSYLYGGGTMTLPASFTYAEYARRGFFELATVTFINFIIVLSCIKFVKRDNRTLVTIGNILFTALIFFTLNMLYSANFKLTLYESSFGYTYLRVFVHLFMLLLFILSIIVLVGIWYRKVPVMKSIILITLIMYTVINYLNIDAFIARKNIERYHATGSLDVHYLTSLSFEAVPYMVELRNVDDNYIRGAIENNLKHRKEVLDRQNSWSEFNFSKNKMKKLLKQGN
jgi:hypothetical protein